MPFFQSSKTIIMYNGDIVTIYKLPYKTNKHMNNLSKGMTLQDIKKHAYNEKDMEINIELVFG